MADEDDLDQEVEETETPAPEAAAGSPELDKLRKENRSLRQRLRRSELTTKFGAEVVELIPDELPIKKWEDFAEKLADKMPKAEQTAPTEQATEQAAEEPPTPTEQRLAAVTTGPPPGAQVPPAEAPDAQGIKELFEQGRGTEALAEIKKRYGTP